MNHLNDLVDVWGASMVRASWQAGIAFLLVWIVCRLFPSIPARCQVWLWRLVLLKFLVAALWILPVELPVLPPRPTAPESVALVDFDHSFPGDAPSKPVAAPAFDRGGGLNPWWMVFLVWFAGAAWRIARIVMACRAASRLRRASRPCGESTLLESAARLAAAVGLRRRPAVLETDGQRSPLLLGISKPAIIVPAGTLRRLDPFQRELVLSHELAHVLHSDIPWNLVAACVKALFFFHPAAWLCERRLRLSQEVAADELAMSVRRETPAEYARQLLQIVVKLGPEGTEPALSVAVVGSHQSLKERFAAMRFILPSTRRHRLAYGLLLGAITLLGVVPWVLVAAEPQKSGPTEVKKPGVLPQPGQQNDPVSKAPSPTGKVVREDRENQPVAEKKPANANDSAQLTIGKGKFVSFADGVLTLEGSAGPLGANKGVEEKISWKNIGDTTNTYLALGEDSGPDRGYKKVATIETLKNVPPGTFVFVGPWFGYRDRPGIFVGINKARSVGTFVSYTKGSKNSGLSLLAKEQTPSGFSKKYGNSLFIRNIPENTPVEESIDGGKYQPAGTVKTALENVQEGAVVTVHTFGEGNITLIQIGVPKDPKQ